MDHGDHEHTEGTMNPHLPPETEMLQAPSSYIATGRIMLLAVLISSILLLLFFIAYIALRHHNRRPARLQYSRPHRLTFSNRAEPSPCRLDRSVIDSIPVIELSLQGDNTTESCAVCISEFTHGQKVRVLPQCRHPFHQGCIDMWFSSHSTCPLCRCDVNLTAKSDSVELEGARSQNKEANTIMEVVVNRDRGGDCSIEETPQPYLPQLNNCSHVTNTVVHPSPLDHVV